jgi:GDP-4-dehydro-6-deoxy-D-mannose reductase
MTTSVGPGTVAVTGVNGFVGRHLAHELAAHGVAVVGIGHEPGADLPGMTEYVEADLTRGWPTLPTVDAIVHLAGLSAVGPSFAQPQRYIEQNSRMVTAMAESLIDAGARSRVLVISSGAVYEPHQELPLDEDARIGHSSPYVVSKLLVEAQAAYYRTRGLDVLVARPFNHVGPGQGPGFLVPDLAAGLRAFAATGEPCVIGDLDTRRDYTDVRDVVRAYRLLLQVADPQHGRFNVCSGVSRSGREVLELLTAAEGLEDVPVRVDPSRVRPGDPRDIRGDYKRLADATGWKPKVSLAASIGDFVTASRGSPSPDRR